jgi:hypothetical protein
MVNDLNIICLTPVKNEAWILHRFLESTSQWADHIIIADQQSDDGSREIARHFSKVKLIDNNSQTFNEPERQKLLIEEARKIPGRKLLIALDADEFFTENFTRTLDWELITSANPGTIINFEWAQVMPDRKHYYIFPARFDLGFMDDGSDHYGKAIHSPRLPIPPDNPQILVNGFKVLHLSMIDIKRFRSKIRWYQCWEYLEGRWEGKGKLLDLYRWYHKDFKIADNKKSKLQNHWFKRGIEATELLRVNEEPYYRWDKEILELFTKYGTKKFSKLAIWDVNWLEMYKKIFKKNPSIDLNDPRSKLEKSIHNYLETSEEYYSRFPSGKKLRYLVWERIIEKIARESGW